MRGRKLRKAKETFSTYAKFNSIFCPRTFLTDSSITQPDPQGYSVLESFYIMETFGVNPKNIPCVRPRPLFYASWGKIQLNWQIEQWAEGYGEWCLFEWELRESYPWFPEWVFNAVLKQGKPIKWINMDRDHKRWENGR